MISVKINLDKAKSNSETSLLFSVSGKDFKRFRITTGAIKVIPKDWDNDKQQIKRSDSHYNHKNRLLQDRKQELETLLFSMEIAKETIDKNALIKRLSYTNSDLIQDNEFDTIFNKFLNEKKLEIKSSSYKSYTSFHNIINDFQDWSKSKININTFNIDNINSFKEYILTVLKNENGGYSVKEKILRTFFNWCNKKGFTSNKPFENIAKTTHKKEIRPLTKNELSILEAATDIFTGKLEIVRRNFLFLCYTGLRYEDGQKTRFTHIDNNIIRIHTSKTGITIKIPIHSKLRKLIDLQKKERNTNDTIFEKTPNQVFNRYLKDIFTELNLTAQTHSFGTIGAERIEKNQTLNEVISSHDGRRTFITLSLSAGMNAQQLMQITGHEDFKSFERYVKFSDTDVHNRFLEVWEKL